MGGSASSPSCPCIPGIRRSFFCSSFLCTLHPRGTLSSSSVRLSERTFPLNPLLRFHVSTYLDNFDWLAVFLYDIVPDEGALVNLIGSTLHTRSEFLLGCSPQTHLTTPHGLEQRAHSRDADSRCSQPQSHAALLK